MNQLFLVSNSHIDPVWLWDWQEGATAAIAAFRAAADFCEEFDGYVFCHNESLLYQWVEEYDPTLFTRIQALVRENKWHIMGGWFLQPDCNLPCGESILRQILTGQAYFKERFDKKPTVAINFDSFGHDRGLVQILAQCGYKGYLFMRPNKAFGTLTLPENYFTWRGYDGSEVIGYRLPGSYGTPLGEAASWAEEWLQKNVDDPIGLFAWGVGNHGGALSRKDLNELNRWMERHPDIQISHSTPEAFFEALEQSGVDCPVFADSLRPVFIGCYTSQARVKRLHRKLENELYSTEKMSFAAACLGLMRYPDRELQDAQWDMLFNEFHDILPGTTMESAALASEQSLMHGLETVGRAKMRAFMALLSGQPKAKPGDAVIFAYNPHPYPVSGVFHCEIMPPDQNYQTENRYTVTVTQNGAVIPSQQEKPECTMSLDWRQRIALYATLPPASMSRFDCAIALAPAQVTKQEAPRDTIHFHNDHMSVCINCKTGLIDDYRVDGVAYLKAGSFSTVLYEDSADPWKMEASSYSNVKGRFAPAKEERTNDSCAFSPTVPTVRIIENGAARMVVESSFRYGQSRLIQTYRLPRFGTSFEVEQRFCWNESDTMAKLEIPCAVEGQYIGQQMYGSAPLAQDGTETVSQKWCGMFAPDRALTVVNTATYGSHASADTMYLSLLRAPAYAAHPIENRPLLPDDRFISRIDQGEHILKFQICGGSNSERRRCVEREAQAYNEPPFVLNAFPGGTGECHAPFITVSDTSVLLTAMKIDNNGALILRLFNASPEPRHATVTMPSLHIQESVELEGNRFQTYIATDGHLTETAPL